MTARQLREGAGLTQRQLADQSGVVRQCISKYERGLIRPQYETAKCISIVLGCDVDTYYESLPPRIKNGDQPT